MAVAEASQPRHAVRAAGLTAALITAKVLALLDRSQAPAWTSLPALIWQDLAAGLAFWLVDRLAGRSRWMWVPYAVLVGYVLVNIAVVSTLGSPLTMTMWRAAGGALGDSVWSALTPRVLFGMAAVIVGAVTGPALGSRMPSTVRRATLLAALLVSMLGAAQSRRIDANGLDRNSITALLLGPPRRLTASGAGGDYRSSPFEQRAGEDLTAYRGSAAGMNVLVVVLESTAARYLASYGAKDDPTPSLTALAGESLVFESAYAAYPESIKGLFAVLCSMTPAIDVPAETLAKSPCDSIVRRFSGAGYRTGLFHAGRFTYLGMQEVLDVQRFDTAEDAGAIGGNLQSSFGIDEPAVVKRILSWVDGPGANRPFFAIYQPTAGHHPYQSTVPGPFPDDTALGAYKNAIHEGDRALATLIEGLRARTLLERTLVVVFGDHGQAFDQHPGNRVHSLYIYDENVRVPLVVRLPAHARDGKQTRIRRVASVVDIGPTILDLAGLPIPSAVEGRSLLAPETRMALFFADYDRGWLGLRDGCWKFMLEVETNRPKLFDVCADPGETRDVVSSEPARVAAYGDRVRQWAAARRSAVLASAAGK